MTSYFYEHDIVVLLKLSEITDTEKANHFSKFK